MTRRIFRSIALVAALVFFSSVALFLGVLYTHFTDVQVSQMEAQATLAQQGVKKDGLRYFDGLKAEGYRITWIDPQGEVLYDSMARADQMGNHSQREEVREAMASGEGHGTRYSETLMAKQFYVAVRSDDGSVIRIADSQHSVLGLLVAMLQPILIIVVIALVLSLLLARRLSKRIIQPLNQIDLDHPEKTEAYEELNPLLDRIRTQQEQISAQAKKLHQKQKEFDTAISGMEEGLLLIGADGHVIAINSAAAEILKADRYSKGRPFSEVISAPQIRQAYDAALGGDHREIMLSSDEAQYRLHAGPVTADGDITAVVILILDVSEQVRAEQMRREFTANVSHELKTPLQTISGNAELIAGGLVRPEDVKTFARRIQEESGRMVSLVEDIIDLSQMDEQRGQMAREEVDLFAIAEQVISSLSTAAAKTRVRLALEGGTALTKGDPDLLRSIIYNLCDNAIKYNRPDGSVTVRVEEEEAGLLVRVTDDGIGIPQEDQGRIFERFYRVDKSRSKDAGGTGLGLSIVKHAVMLHKGQIDVESGPGQGTTITVRLPRS